MADLKSPQIKRDKGETVDRLAVFPAVHLLPEAHQQADGRINQLLVSAKLMPNKAGLGCGHPGVTGKEGVDGMAKENAITVQLLYPALSRTERNIKKEKKELLNVIVEIVEKDSTMWNH